MSRRTSEHTSGSLVEPPIQTPSGIAGTATASPEPASDHDLGSFEYVERLLERQKQERQQGGNGRNPHRLTLELTPAQWVVVNKVALGYAHGPRAEVLVFFVLREFCVRSLCLLDGVTGAEAYARFDDTGKEVVQ